MNLPTTIDSDSGTYAGNFASKQRFTCLVAATAALTLPAYLARNPLKTLGVTNATEVAYSEEDFTAKTDISSIEQRSLSHSQASELIRSALIENQLNPSRSELTADGSSLFQFLDKDIKACVDLYPDGDLIVLIKRDDTDEIHELLFDDSKHMIELLKDAGVA